MPDGGPIQKDFAPQRIRPPQPFPSRSKEPEAMALRTALDHPFTGPVHIHADALGAALDEFGKPSGSRAPRL